MEATKIITELSEIEAAAKEILDQIDKRKQDYADQIDDQRHHFYEGLEKSSKETIAAYSNELQEKASHELAVLFHDQKSAIDELEDDYERNHRKWATEIFEALIRE